MILEMIDFPNTKVYRDYIGIKRGITYKKVTLIREKKLNDYPNNKEYLSSDKEIWDT